MWELGQLSSNLGSSETAFQEGKPQDYRFEPWPHWNSTALYEAILFHTQTSNMSLLKTSRSWVHMEFMKHKNTLAFVHLSAGIDKGLLTVGESVKETTLQKHTGSISDRKWTGSEKEKEYRLHWSSWWCLSCIISCAAVSHVNKYGTLNKYPLWFPGLAILAKHIENIFLYCSTFVIKVFPIFYFHLCGLNHSIIYKMLCWYSKF